MGRDEQKEEREVLDSIFPDEITDISEFDYRISIPLDLPQQDGEESTDSRPVILLGVHYPEEYPDLGPTLEISSPPNAPKHRYIDIQDDRIRLLEELQPTVDENVGMAMVFTLVSTLKDNAEQLMLERHQAEQAIKDAERAKLEAEENKKFQGTQVTRTTFLEWRTNFKKEMEEEEKRRQEEKEAEDKKKRISKEERKMTGKELWEKGLTGKVEEDDDGDSALPQVKHLEIED